MKQNTAREELTYEQAAALRTMLENYDDDPRMRCLAGLLPENRHHKKPNVRECAGIGAWCAPGDRQQQKWLLTFDDSDRNYALYDDEARARDGFGRAEAMGWNCYLWCISARKHGAR